MSWCKVCGCSRMFLDIKHRTRAQCPACGTIYTYEEVDEMDKEHEKELKKLKSRPEINPEKWRDFEDGWRPDEWDKS